MTSSRSLASKNPLERMQLLLPKLSKTHRKIALYILNHYDDAAFYTSSQLSRACAVSESSVLRLAGALDYAGYTDFQRALQAILKDRLSLSQRLESLGDKDTSPLSILQSVMHHSTDSINRTLTSLDPNHFQNTVDLLANAKRVFLFGSRSSYALAYFFSLELQWIRDNVYVINSQTPEFDALSTLTNEDVFLAISQQRYLRATTNALKLAHMRGVPTVAITDSPASPLVPYARHALLVESEIFSFSDNIVPIACIITALLNAVGAARQPESSKRLAAHEETWDFFDIYMR